MARKKATKAKAKAKTASKRARKPARKKVEAVPKAYGSITPGLSIRGAAAAIPWYEKAFGAKELYRLSDPGGQVMHAEVKFGDSIVMLGEEAPEMGAASPQTLSGTSVALMFYVKDVDASFARAVAAGATAVQPPTDMFWGDRYSQVRDPYGHRWAIATHKADLTPAQMKKGMDAWMASMSGPPA